MSTTVIQETIPQWQAEPEKAIVKPTVKGRSDGAQAMSDTKTFPAQKDGHYYLTEGGSETEIM